MQWFDNEFDMDISAASLQTKINKDISTVIYTIIPSFFFVLHVFPRNTT